MPRHAAFALTAAIALAACLGVPAHAQVAAGDSLATVRVDVRHDTAMVDAAVVRAGRTGAQTDARGRAVLRLVPGTHTIVAGKFGLRPDSLVLTLRAGLDTLVTIALEASVTEIESVVVSATRSERRVEDVPLRVEVIDEEEIAEKVAMTPGDIAMMLNETSGLRVQVTSPSLGGASVRIQGLPGRHSLILADGLPLHGQAGGLGLLQIPPVDLARVEVIKGTASALYGSAALGGVVNLLSRRPGDEPAHTALVNRTSRGGTDGVVFLTAPLSPRWGYTLLAGAHHQGQRDLDADGWIDLPGYARTVVRPRFHFGDGAGRSAFITAGFTGEGRDGGTIDGAVAPDGLPFAEGLTTRRADAGALARWVVQDSTRALHGAIVTLRGSAVEQRHAHRFGPVRERDRHRSWFGEAAIAVPRGRATWVGGVAYQQDAYRATDVAGFDYTFRVPAVFGQLDVDPAPWMSLSASARADAHSEYGTTLNPRVSLLLRHREDGALAGWTARASAGTGAFAPTPFTEATEATGLATLVPLADLQQERATSGAFDIGGPLALPFARLELNATAFASRVRLPLQVIDADGLVVDGTGATGGTTAAGATSIQLVNAPGPTRTWGGELLARLVRELGADGEEGGEVVDGEEGEAEPAALRITGTYTYLRSTECDPESGAACTRREVPLTPRHAAGIVAAIEQEGVSRVGVELYYTGRQSLDGNPYRTESRPYVVLGLLGERAFTTAVGTARVFLNLENLTGVRQTRYDPLVLPARGQGGRWTTDAWTELAGFTANGGVRFAF